MLIIKKNFLFNSLIILSFILLSLISVIFLLKNNVLYLGMDTQFHFRRINELIISLKNMDILPNFSFNEFHGSGVLTLYPYFNLLPVVILSFIFKSQMALVYSTVIFNVLLTFIISFYSCKNYIKSYITSYVFSVIYSMSNIFLLNNIMSSDFGIISSYIILPLIIFGFLKVIQGKNSWIQLSIGMSMLLYSHILNVIIVSLFLLLFLFINIRRIDKTIINNLFKSITVFMLITAIIWLPFLRLYFTNLNNINTPTANILNNINIKMFLSGLYGSKSDQSIGFFPLIALFISPFIYKKFDRYEKQIYILSLIVILSALFFPWRFIVSYEIFRPLNQLQFINRILIIPLMLLSFIFSLITTKHLNKNKVVIISSLTIFIAIVLQLFIGQYLMIYKFSQNSSVDNYLYEKKSNVDISKIWYHPIHNNRQFFQILGNYYQADDDYIPKRAIPFSSYVNNDLGFYNDYRKIKVNYIRYNTFKFSSNDNINKLSLPIYAYNKENLHVYLNNKAVNNYADKNGLLTIDNIQNNVKLNNKIFIKPAPDSFRIIGSILSIFGWAFALGILIKRKL